MYNEFLRLLCNLFIVALLAALPLYTGQGYWQLGDTKYYLFRNITLLCLGCWLVVGMPGRIKAATEYVRLHREGGAWHGKQPFSVMDGAVAAYGVCVVVSALCSSYGQLAWRGYTGWHMGAFAQLLFVGIYFYVSRQYDGSKWPLYIGEAALFAATVLGLLHRLGIDPLGLLEGWNSMNWEYSHMLSTLGNINWLCGYYSVALAFLMAHYLSEKRRRLLVVLYMETVFVFVLLGIQGSQGGLLILAVCGVVCLFLGRQNAAVLQRLFLAFIGFFAGMPVMGRLMELRGEEAAIVRDGNVFDEVRGYVWLIAVIACLVCWLFLRQTNRRGASVWQRLGNALGVVLVIGGVAAALLLFVRILQSGIDDSFGNGRGYLWRISWESFQSAGCKDRLLGAGPDCYAEAVFARHEGTDVWDGEHWEGAIFTNAHCEMLSQLCNVGILGMVSYLAVFLAGWCRYGGLSGFRHILRGRQPADRRKEDQEADQALEEETGWKDWNISWLGPLAVAMYGAHSLISFQQVLAAPLLFLALGLCECRVRNLY